MHSLLQDLSHGTVICELVTVYRTRPFTEFWEVSIEHSRRVWHADRDAYSSGHLVPSLWDLHMFYLLRPMLFPNLPLFVRTMLFEYPSVLISVIYWNVKNGKWARRLPMLNDSPKTGVTVLVGKWLNNISFCDSQHVPSVFWWHG